MRASLFLMAFAAVAANQEWDKNATACTSVFQKKSFDKRLKNKDKKYDGYTIQDVQQTIAKKENNTCEAISSVATELKCKETLFECSRLREKKGIGCPPYKNECVRQLMLLCGKKWCCNFVQKGASNSVQTSQAKECLAQVDAKSGEAVASTGPGVGIPKNIYFCREMLDWMQRFSQTANTDRFGKEPKASDSEASKKRRKPTTKKGGKSKKQRKGKGAASKVDATKKDTTGQGDKNAILLQRSLVSSHVDRGHLEETLSTKCL